MFQFRSDKRQLFVSFSCPGNVIVSLRFTRINCGDTWSSPCLGFLCDLISSRAADCLARDHRVKCWHAGLWLSVFPSWICEIGRARPSGGSGRLQVRGTARVQTKESIKLSIQSKMEKNANEASFVGQGELNQLWPSPTSHPPIYVGRTAPPQR